MKKMNNNKKRQLRNRSKLKSVSGNRFRISVFKSLKNLPNIKATDINHFSSFDIIKFKKVIFTETSVKELEKRYE